MLDLHNHVLFGLDDGCRTLEESRALAAQARACGHIGFVATPHIRAGLFDNTPEQIRSRFLATRAVVLEAGLELYLGAEHYFDAALLSSARAHELLTLGETSRFVLTEFPQMMLPPNYEDVLFELRLLGYVPVIAHPERCRGVARNVMHALEVFRRAEVLLQLDLGSLIGHYGRTAQTTAEKLLAEGAYHVAACDLHRPEDVEALVEPSLSVLTRHLDRLGKGDGLQTLTQTNPRRILENSPLESMASV